MAFSYVTLKKEENNNVSYKTGYYGLSFMSLLFPGLVALLRKNYTVMICILVIYQAYSIMWQNFFLYSQVDEVLAGGIVPVFFAKFIILNILFVFCYNRFEISILENTGYKVCAENEKPAKEKYKMAVDEELKDILRAKR
jgi:hypothetical protein